MSRISGATVTILALLLYVGGGLVLPLTLGWPTWGLVEANVVGTILAAVVSLGWFAVRIEAGNRRRLVEWTTDLRRLDSSEFEWLVGEVFRREGWTVRETGRPDGPDGNIDLDLTRDRQRKIVQCKRWTSRSVDVDEIRRFLGTLMREKLPEDAGIFVTLSSFTEQARQEAQQAGITLIDSRELGGFNWTSQHLDSGGVRCATRTDRRRFAFTGGRSLRPDGPVWLGVRIGSDSGRESLAA